MKITTITYEMKRSNGNYGSDGVTLEAQLDNEEPLVALQALKVLADYQLNHERRETVAEEQGDILADPNASDERKEKANRYLEKYETWSAEVVEAHKYLKQEQALRAE